MTSDYGTYRLTYTPPESQGNEDYPAIAIEMSTSGDANVDQMLRLYEAFLAASGYYLKGDLQVVERDSNLNSWSTGSLTFSSLGTGAMPIGSTPPSGIDGSYWEGK